LLFFNEKNADFKKISLNLLSHEKNGDIGFFFFFIYLLNVFLKNILSYFIF